MIFYIVTSVALKNMPYMTWSYRYCHEYINELWLISGVSSHSRNLISIYKIFKETPDLPGSILLRSGLWFQPISRIKLLGR